MQKSEPVNPISDSLWRIIQNIGLEALIAARFVVNSYKAANVPERAAYFVVYDVLKNSTISAAEATTLFDALWHNNIEAEILNDELVLTTQQENEYGRSSKCKQNANFEHNALGS